MRSVALFALLASILAATVTAAPLVSYTFVYSSYHLHYLKKISGIRKSDLNLGTSAAVSLIIPLTLFPLTYMHVIYRPILRVGGVERTFLLRNGSVRKTFRRIVGSVERMFLPQNGNVEKIFQLLSGDVEQ
jgi:hypothetical protein